MDIVIYLLAILGLVFLLKESDGPWGLFNKTRMLLFNNKYVGVFFYKLLSCSYCTGFHAGYLIYLFANYKNWQWNFIILWGLAGAILSLIFEAVMNKLSMD